MAKLKAPLFSFGASGKLANSLVFLPWKGLNNVRQYVVPANPKTSGQITQRGYVSAAVADIHAAMADLTHPCTSADKSSYSLAGSLHPTPRTWFNEVIKIMVDAWVDVQQASSIRAGTVVYLAATTATFAGWTVAGGAMTGFAKYGTSKTSLLKSVAADIAANNFSAVLTGLIVGTTYYVQWQGTPVATKTVCKSGIYVYKHAAP